jgi:hypothetical protein
MQHKPCHRRCFCLASPSARDRRSDPFLLRPLSQNYSALFTLLRPRPAQRRRPAARGRLRPAAAPDLVRPRARHAGSAVGHRHPLVRPQPPCRRPDLPSAERRAPARSGSPRSGTGAPRRRAASWTAQARCYARWPGKAHFTPGPGGASRSPAERLTAGRKSNADCRSFRRSTNLARTGTGDRGSVRHVWMPHESPFGADPPA